MKGYAMLRIGEAGWIEKEDPKCGPMDAICRPIALAPCSSDHPHRLRGSQHDARPRGSR